MKRKPKLINRFTVKNKGPCTISSIGIIGTHRGAGVTFTALMLAIYLGELTDKDTALLEINCHQDMDRLKYMYEWAKEDEVSFSYHNTTIYKEVKEHQLSYILNQKYGYNVLDFGSDFQKNKNLFLRCNIKIVIGSRVEWNYNKLKQFIIETEHILGSEEWLYFIPLVDEKLVKKLRLELKRKVYGIPFVNNPFNPSMEVFRMFRKCSL